MGSITELAQAAARAVNGQSGHWGEDVLAALRIAQDRANGHIGELFAGISGGMAEFLRDPEAYLGFRPTYSFTGAALPAPFDVLTRGGLGTRIDSAGLVGYGAHNLAAGSGTQSITTLAQQYTVRVTGAGTVTLSGTAAGTLTAGDTTVTCTAGTLTLTVSGTVTGLRVCAGPSIIGDVTTTSAAKYLLRQTYDPVTHSAVGLLVEAQATNLVSTNFANWSVFRSKPITVGADGWTLFEYDGVSAPSYGAYRQNAPVWVGGTTYRFALDIWPGQATQTIRFSYVDSNSGYTGGTSTFAFTDSGASCTITDVGGAVGTARRISPTGAWRCVVSFSTISEPTYNYIDFGQSAGVVSGSSFRARLPQVEIGSVVTSYIPNPTTGSMLRIADAISDTAVYSALFGASGAMSVRWDDSAHGAIGKRAYDVLTCSASGTTTNEAWSIGVTAAGGVEVLCRTGGVTTTLALGAGTVGGENTVVLSWGGGTVRASLNGGAEQSGSSATPACNTLHTGDSASIKGAATTILGWISNEGTTLLGAGAVQALCATRVTQ